MTGEETELQSSSLYLADEEDLVPHRENIMKHSESAREPVSSVVSGKPSLTLSSPTARMQRAAGCRGVDGTVDWSSSFNASFPQKRHRRVEDTQTAKTDHTKYHQFHRPSYGVTKAVFLRHRLVPKIGWEKI